MYSLAFTLSIAFNRVNDTRFLRVISQMLPSPAKGEIA